MLISSINVEVGYVFTPVCLSVHNQDLKKLLIDFYKT